MDQYKNPNNNVNFVSEYDLDLSHFNDINNYDGKTDSRHLVDSANTSL